MQDELELSQGSLYLLDGMALVYRAHFAFMTRPILTSGGLNTSAVFGFVNTLLEILETRTPSHIAVAFDTPEPTARHKLYPEYKAQREAMPEELAAAIPLVKRLIRAFNIPVLEYPGFEADDVIGTFARSAEKEGLHTFMVTPDKDYAQLVDTHTFMMKPARKGSGVDVLGLAEIREQWGISRPEQVIDILGLMGDSSDNIPGVPGVGPKTAQKLIATYGDMENLLASTGELKGKQKERLEEFADQARLSKDLATIECEVPVTEKLDDLKRVDRDDKALQELLVELEFNAIGKRLYGEAFVAGRGQEAKEIQGDLFSEGVVQLSAKLNSFDAQKVKYSTVQPEDIGEWLDAARKTGEVCFDLETDSLDVKTASVLGVALSVKAGEAIWVPTDKDDCAQLALLNDLWGDASVTKIGHNLKFDLGVLFAQGIDVEGPFFDTMIAHALVEPSLRHGMDFLAEALLSYKPIPITDLIGPKGPDQKSLREVEPEHLQNYAAEDADITFQLKALVEKMLEDKEQAQVFRDIEMPLVPVLTRMELEGIRVNADELGEFSTVLGEKLEEMKAEILDQAGEDFNLNSPKQLGVILFEKLKLVDKPKKTKSGQYSTNEQTLSALAPKHPIVQNILDYREIGKLKSTYVDSLPSQIHPATGRIHTTYSQTGAATGRLSSNDPNLQNIPIRTELGRHIRKAFEPRGSEYVLLAADYSQIELRIMASESADPGMKQAFELGWDIHSATAARVYGVDLEEVSREMRRKSKMVNFGIIYGISAFGLSQRLGIPRGEASDIIKEYFKQYPGVKSWMDQTVEFCKEHGYVETPCGRRRWLPDINSRNKTVSSAAERTAINSPIQGAAADMIKRAMIKVDAFLRQGNYKTRMLLQVHDELVFDLHKDEVEELPAKICAIMAEAMPLDVPVVVEDGTGTDWLEAH